MWGPTGHLGSLPGPWSSDILADWIFFALTKFPLEKKEVHRFSSLVAHRVFKEIEILLVLLLKSKFSEQFQSALLGAPLVPPTKDSGRALMVSHLKGGNSSQKIYSHCSCAKAAMSPGLSLSPFCKQLFHMGKKREQRQILLSARNLSNTFGPQSLRQLGVCWRKRKIKYRAGQGRTKLTWLKANPNFSCCKFGGRHAVPSFLPHHSHTQNNLKLVVKKINCRESPWRALAANCSH